MTTNLDSLPKPAKTLPDDAKEVWVANYNEDFAWRCSEAHAEKAAWLAVKRRWHQIEGEWVEQ